MLEYSNLTKDAVRAHVDAVAKLRLSIFQDYPYLYQGTIEYEREYLSKLSASEKGIIVAAKVGDMVVGVATGMPLADEHDVLKEPFKQHGTPIEDVFYFAESLILPRYRGQGAGHKFFDFREDWARSLGFKRATFCTVLRPDDHHLKPRDYKPLDPFWTRRGYSALASHVAQFPWKEIGEDEESPKPMQFWIGDL
jgi:GNAT superfamily N-acetyltransferase